MVDFIFATACNRPRLHDPQAAQVIIGRYYFDWDLEVGIECDPVSKDNRLTISGEGWPGAWLKPTPLPEDWEPRFEDDGMVGFEDLLRELAPQLAEPLTVQAVGINQRRFPLSAGEWRVLPGVAKIGINRFKYGAADTEPATEKPQLAPVAHEVAA